MILILFFLSVLFLLEPTSVKGFTYQFTLENNAINLDFIKVKAEPTVSPVINNPTITPSGSNSILSFNYKIEAEQSLPTDIPLFIVAYDKEVIFSADASLADNVSRSVEIDLKDFAFGESKQMPIFYQNNFLEGYDLSLLDLNFINQATAVKSPAEISDLNIIREKDDYLTVIFSLQEEVKNIHSYQLFCLNKNQEIVNSIKLSQKDNFLWPEYSFTNLHTNQKNELIFHLKEFNCDDDIYVVGDGFFESNRTSIIELEDL